MADEDEVLEPEPAPAPLDEAGQPLHEEIDWDEIDWPALDRANDQVGREPTEDLGPIEERAEILADIWGGLFGDKAIEMWDLAERVNRGEEVPTESAEPTP